MKLDDEAWLNDRREHVVDLVLAYVAA